MSKRRKKVLMIIAAFLIAVIIIAGAYLYCKYKYPLKYETLIEEYSQEFSLDPYLVATVVWAESRFNPAAVSGSGAIGLMQIMPETGKWIAGKLGVKDYTSDLLYTAGINIQFGCWYLSYLENKFDGDMIKILAGYNAGPNKVEQWEEEWGEEYSPIWEDIPYEETKNYVKKIQSAEKIYKILYDIG